MPAPWINERILITVRTYPVPARSGIEVSCTAAITAAGKWVRVFPVPYRHLAPDQKFSKYQWVDVALQRSKSDARPESHKLNIETIRLGDTLTAADNWRARKDMLQPLFRPSLCAIKRELEEHGAPTLGIFTPAKIQGLTIKPTSSDWTPDQKAILSQKLLFVGNEPDQELEKIPFDFVYKFKCANEACNGHELGCTDWEMAQAYRKWKADYGDGWEAKFRQRFEHEMINHNETSFFVGTIHAHPKNWMIVGLFYPRKSDQAELFLN